MSEQDTIKKLRANYGNEIINVSFLPRPYCPGGIENVKAIYLGCDPSNKHSNELPFVFAHESGLTVFNRFINAHTEQLREIGLSWHCVYTQNLCRSYFDKETSANRKLWKRVVNEYWIEALKSELTIFPSSIPVFLTAQILLEVLASNGYETINAPDFYQCNVSIPVPAESSKLGRRLIPLYRGKSPKFEISYHLKNKEWDQYRNSIINILK